MSLRCCRILPLEAKGQESPAKSFGVLQAHLSFPERSRQRDRARPTAGFSGVSPARPSSTATTKHSQTHGNFAVSAILHPRAAQQSRRTLQDVPEDGPRSGGGSGFGLTPPQPLSLGPKSGRQRGTQHLLLFGWMARSYSFKQSRATPLWGPASKGLHI